LHASVWVRAVDHPRSRWSWATALEFMIMPTDDQDTSTRGERPGGSSNLGIHHDNAELVGRPVYLPGRWVTEWRRAAWCWPVTLPSDAPFMGQGFNSGIRDAANLAWRLALLVDGKGRESLLDDYAAERGTQVVQIVEQTVLIGQMFCMTDPRVRSARRGAHEPGEPKYARSKPELAPTRRHAARRRDRRQPGLQATVGTNTRTALLDEIIAPPSFVLLGRDRSGRPAVSQCKPTGSDSEGVAPTSALAADGRRGQVRAMV